MLSDEDDKYLCNNDFNNGDDKGSSGGGDDSGYHVGNVRTHRRTEEEDFCEVRRLTYHVSGNKCRSCR